MKNYLYIAILMCCSFFKINGQTAIRSNINTPSSRYTLEANTDYDIYLKAYVDASATIEGFTTTFNNEFPLKWEFDKFEKDKWVLLKHSFKTTSELVNPILQIELLSNSLLEEGTGVFYMDDIRIVENKTLNIQPVSFDNEIKVYPNPVKDKILYIENLKNIENITLYNLNGSVITTELDLKEIKDGVEEFDLSFLKRGAYILKITTQKAKTFRKVIID